MPVIPPPILPKPVEMVLHSGHFLFSADTQVSADAANQGNAAWLAEYLGLKIEIEPEAAQNTIYLESGGEDLLKGQQAEGYLLDVFPHEIRITAPGSAGVFNGMQTLRQLLPVEIEKHEMIKDPTWVIPCLAIRDWPRYAWRGFMLDEGRFFHGKETVKFYLDLMALQKLNVFHWHLTEDQGWRIQIQRYPLLTEVGSRRPGSASGFISKPDGIPHAGFYDQDDIREIVAYAEARHIQVIPEIDMPGHSMAALAAYPEYGCTGGPYQVSRKWGIFPDLYCPGREATFTFLQDILEEVSTLFPAPYIHIGGDETPPKRWRSCPACQERIRKEGLVDETDLKVYFLNRMADWLEQHNRTPIGWSEILHPGLEKNTMVQYWVGKSSKFMEAMRQGRNLVMSDFKRTYLDHSYALTPLSKAYAYEPETWGLDASLARHILGLEALLWSEFVPDRKRLDYQVFPRLCAMAETGWTQREQKDFNDFRKRLEFFEERLETLGVEHAHSWQVEPAWYKQLFGIFTIAQSQNRTAD